MNFSEKCKQCSVMVDGGSGVLFQPMTEEYSYILTAKHNLYYDQEFGSHNQPKNINEIKIDGTDEQIEDKYEHSKLDIAILKIAKREFESPCKEFKQQNIGNIFKFYGYSEIRRTKTNEINYFDLKVGHIIGVEITASNEEYFPKKYIDGCSGGGVFRQDGDNFYLVGIEHSMDALSDDEAEQNVRVKYIDINAFDEIIADNKEELEPLYPPYMNDFTMIVDEIFLLNDFENKRDIIRDRLKYLAQHYTKKIKPIMIKKEFEDELLINGLKSNDTINQQLWSMYLEFILLFILIENKEEVTLEKIKEIYKKRKFIFAKADRWITLKEDILKSNLLGLNKGGTVFIACEHDRRPNKVVWSTKSILDISRPPQPEEMRIDQGIDYTKDFKYKHIYAIEKLLLDHEDELTQVTSHTIDKVLKEVLQNVCNEN